MRILLVEDQLQQAQYTEKALREGGHAVDVAHDGKHGLFLASTEPYEVIILDRMLPQVDGLTVLRTLRASGTHTPVLLLTALADVDDRVEGLRTGADDYLGKPFSTAELLARIDALGRRRQPASAEQSHQLQVEDLYLDRLSRTVRRGTRKLDLQPREYQLLEFLMRHAGHVVTRTMLLEGVWNYHFDPGTNVIDVHISKLRGKIDADGLPTLLHTVRGAGYRLGQPEQ
ncbi:response regulator transcription factor [Chitinilyticum piscinae]|uniref:Response regulator transcription factor n=1 Tax=Chitinilyticum piscinae TaxID=2866724 RepID=A0A8J7FH53_9NEIS|nr:response regulator transcription factor [Chitinilyticum piscinae]MBE9608100.1 response regulator transcription factor [Chitinilyticum piscinae]